MADLIQSLLLSGKAVLDLLKLFFAFFDLSGMFRFQLLLRSSSEGFDVGRLLSQQGFRILHAANGCRGLGRVRWVRRSDS